MIVTKMSGSVAAEDATGGGIRIAFVGPFTLASSTVLQPHLYAGSSLVLFDDITCPEFIRTVLTGAITHVLLGTDSLRQLMDGGGRLELEQSKALKPDDLPQRILGDKPGEAPGTSDDHDCAAVEAALYTHSAIMEACVIKIRDEVHNERLKAVVSLRPGKQASRAELIAHCRASNAEHQCPASVDFVAELPKNASGNVARKLIREQYRQAYRLPR